jgi:S1-C subfamily serine protease
MKINIASANDHFDMTKLDDQTQKQIKAACYFEKMNSSKVYADCLAKETRKVFSATKHRLKTNPTSGSEMPTPRWSSSADNAATNWGGRQTASNIFENLKESVFKIFVFKSQADFDEDKHSGQGSGVAVSANTVLTNCHVAQKGAVLVLVNKQMLTNGKLMKANSSKDACVLRVKDNLIPVPTLREYSSLEIGETVYSLGSPYGHLNTFAEGIISGLRPCSVSSLFPKDKDTKCIQTSAPISPGSSGGGLFDKAGNLIGINTFMHRDSQNLNFAVDVGEYWK